MRLVATDLGYSIDGADLIRGVSLAVDSGEVVAVLGPNGAGKSTLLRLLAGDLVPSRGSVRLGSMAVAEASEHDLAVRRAFLGQKPRMDLAFTVREVVGMGRYPHRLDPDNSAANDAGVVDGAMDRVGVGHLADRTAGTLSGGEQQRVSLARVIAQSTPVVLMDEPTTFTDVAHAEAIMTETHRMAEAGGSVVAVVHDLNLAATHADRMILLAAGRAVAAGPPPRC